MDAHANPEPSAWVRRWLGLVAPGGDVLDLACGRGRHARFAAGRGHPVTAVDRDRDALATLDGVVGVRTLCTDLEGGRPWPLAGRRFAGIVVTNYLHRPLYPHLLDALDDGGVLIYETFALGNARFGKPSNPEFLLRPGELLAWLGASITVVAFEQGVVGGPSPAVVQRVCAARRPAEAVVLDGGK